MTPGQLPPPAAAPDGCRTAFARRAAAALALIAALTACGLLARPAAAPIPVEVALEPTSLPTPTPVPTLTATPAVQPSVLPSPAPPATATPAYAWLPGEVRVFPGPDHYVGDVITVEVVVENIALLPAEKGATLWLENTLISDQPEVVYSPLRRSALTFRRAWDTAGLDPGLYHLAVELEGEQDGAVIGIDFRVDLLPAEQRPAAEQEATWAWRDTPTCCRIAYLTGTAAERDLEAIADSAEEAVAAVEERLGLSITSRPIPITLINNVWGNGAYAGQELVFSYVDRDYTAADFPTVLRHEAAHWAAREIASPQMPSMLSEGLAVYAAGGHYKPEPLRARAAALQALDRSIPLADLADGFWDYQHEIAYLEAAGFTTYLIETYGIARFRTLIAFEDGSAETPSVWLDTALRRVSGMSLAGAEQGYRAWLQPVDPAGQVDDLRLTIALSDTVRRYQQLYAAYQESLPGAADAAAAGAVSEFMRRPDSDYNVTLEALLGSAQRALRMGSYAQAEALMLAVEQTLDDADFTRELVADYLAITRRISAEGYRVQTIEIQDDSAIVTAVRTPPLIRTFNLSLEGDSWDIAR